MTSRIVKVEPFDLIVFGGTGDLAFRKLFPALFHRDLDGQLTDPTRIVGVSRRPVSTSDYRASVRAALEKCLPAEQRKADVLDRFTARLDYVSTDAAAEGGSGALAERLGNHAGTTRVFYLATSPDLFGGIARSLAAAGLADPTARIVVEKPLGKDLDSARAINDAIGAVFAEQQVFRIDHYLGKETVQNLMALRFANRLFEPLWNAAHIDHVQITVAEQIGVEGRGAYYDGSGALRDMVQNHLLQLLCLVAMEPPSSMSADAVRDEKLKIMKALVPVDDAGALATTVRGQYKAGISGTEAVPGYLEEIGRAESDTETFVALKIGIANWRWAGVPFYVRTGKRLAARGSEVVVSFRAIPHSIFEPAAGAVLANRLVIRLQPDEGIKLWLMIKEPGPGGMRLHRVPLDMSFAQTFHERFPEAYERLLMDVVRGNATLFMRRDEVEAAWRWVDPIRSAWLSLASPPRLYPAGSWGPTASISLIERDGRTWNEEW
jgi:glucose-6-phosphate 1-dehydrogenase